MINKENFIKYINKIHQFRTIETNINKAGKELESFSISFAIYEQLAVDILEDIFEDKEYGWINYYLYELNFGSKWKENCITMDGKDVPMRDAGELYDVLIDNLKNEKGKEKIIK